MRVGGETGLRVVAANSADTLERSRCLKGMCSSSAALLMTLNASSSLMSLGRFVRRPISEKEVGARPPGDGSMTLLSPMSPSFSSSSLVTSSSKLRRSFRWSESSSLLLSSVGSFLFSSSLASLLSTGERDREEALNTFN